MDFSTTVVTTHYRFIVLLLHKQMKIEHIGGKNEGMRPHRMLSPATTKKSLETPGSANWKSMCNDGMPPMPTIKQCLKFVLITTVFQH